MNPWETTGTILGWIVLVIVALVAIALALLALFIIGLIIVTIAQQLIRVARGKPRPAGQLISLPGRKPKGDTPA